MTKEDKVSLIRQRVELVAVLTEPLLYHEERVRIQGELAVLNAKIKALNTTEAAQLKALADRRKAAGRAVAQANGARALARVQGLPSENSNKADEDPEQLSAIDAWIDALLLRHDVDFSRSRTGKITFAHTTEGATLLEALITSLYAAAQDQELPELPSVPSTPKSPGKPKKR